MARVRPAQCIRRTRLPVCRLTDDVSRTKTAFTVNSLEPHINPLGSIVIPLATQTSPLCPIHIPLSLFGWLAPCAQPDTHGLKLGAGSGELHCDCACSRWRRHEAPRQASWPDGWLLAESAELTHIRLASWQKCQLACCLDWPLKSGSAGD